jgi:thiol-disulfide isomerase/thioredoxin
VTAAADGIYFRLAQSNRGIPNMKIYFALFFVLLAVVVNPLYAKTPGEIEVGVILRDAHLDGLTTHPKKLSSFRGKPLIINVWASWCGPCRQEMGSLDRLSRRYGGKQFNVIGISTDDSMDAAYAFLERSNTSFDNFIDKKLRLENMLGADRLPLTLLIDAQGRVLGKYYGAKVWDGLEAKSLIEKMFGIRM